MTKALLQFLVDAYAHHTAPELFPDAPPIGRGIGLAFGLFAMQGTWRYIRAGWWSSEMVLSQSWGAWLGIRRSNMVCKLVS